jgi:hypothetical protein
MAFSTRFTPYSEPLCTKFYSKLWTFQRLNQRLSTNISAVPIAVHRRIRKEALKKLRRVQLEASLVASTFSLVDDGIFGGPEVFGV